LKKIRRITKKVRFTELYWLHSNDRHIVTSCVRVLVKSLSAARCHCQQ